MGNSPIVLKELSEQQQQAEHHKRYSKEPVGQRTDWVVLYFITLKTKSSNTKRQLEVNFSPRSNRWFLCPYNQTMDVLASGSERPTKQKLEDEIKEKQDQWFQ